MDIMQVNNTGIWKAFRFIKTKFSLNSQQTVQIAPFGDDSVPPINYKGVKTGTTTAGINIVVGYFNRKQVATSGEKYFYSLKENGDDSFYIYLKKDGTLELGGTGDFLVRYNELEKAFNQLKSDFNSFVTKYNTHTHAGNGVVTTNTTTQTSASVSKAKIAEIKVTSNI